jgi:hypothetical protein
VQHAYGIALEEIPAHATPLEAVVIVKALDEDNQLCLYRRGSNGLTPWEIVGILQVLLDRARDDAQEGYEEDAGDDE